MTIKQLFKKNGILLNANMGITTLALAWNKLPPQAKALIPGVGTALAALATLKTTVTSLQNTYTTVESTLTETKNKIIDGVASLTPTPIGPAKAASETAKAALPGPLTALENSETNLVEYITNTNIPGL